MTQQPSTGVAAPGSAEPQPVRLLVADDLESDTELFRLALRRASVPCAIRRVDTREALEEALKDRYDVALVDYRMPKLGLEVAVRTIREHDSSLPIILTSSIVGERELSAMVQLGCDDILTKDKIDILADTIRQVQERREETRRRLAAEAERRRTEARYRALFEQAHEGVLLVRAEGEVLRVIDANPSAARLLGHERDKLIGCVCHDVLPQEVSQTLGPSLLEDLQKTSGEADVRRMEFSYVCAGEERCVEAVVSRVAVEGEDPFAQIILRDITAQKRLEEERNQHTEALEAAVAAATEQLREQNTLLEKANKAKRDFLKLMHHEFKTPLTGMEGHLDLLEPKIADQRGKQSLQHIRLCFERLKRLVSDLMRMAELESSELVVVLGEVKPSEMLESLAADFEAYVKAKEITLTTFADPHVSYVIGDRERMHQVLGNLLSNAIKFTEARGEIVVRIEPAGPDRAKIEVGDTGIGIPAEDLPHVFDQFYRGKGAEERMVAGTGIGLAVAKLLVEAQGGEIHVRSKVGEGSTFTILVPAKCEVA